MHFSCLSNILVIFFFFPLLDIFFISVPHMSSCNIHVVYMQWSMMYFVMFTLYKWDVLQLSLSIHIVPVSVL